MIVDLAGLDAFTQQLHPESLKILMVGDVIGKPGRKILSRILPELIAQLSIDFTTVNGENSAGGFGITQKIFEELRSVGVNAVTMGNHWADKPDVHVIRANHVELVLPQNLPDLSGVTEIKEYFVPKFQRNIAVINLMGVYAMKNTYENPFDFLESNHQQMLAKRKSGQTFYIVDIHAEATSEKQAIGCYLDGLASVVVGTHTHTPTSDERILAKGTAYLSDLGMTGPYDSVLGMTVERCLPRYFKSFKKKPLEVAEGNNWFCGFLSEICPKSGMAIAAHRIQYREEDALWRVSSVMKKH